MVVTKCGAVWCIYPSYLPTPYWNTGTNEVHSWRKVVQEATIRHNVVHMAQGECPNIDWIMHMARHIWCLD